MAELYAGRGYWWLPGREKDKVAGDLVFDSESGGTLSLIGALSVWTDYAEPETSDDGSTSFTLTREVQERAGRYPRIYGEVAGRPLTLDDCFQTRVIGGFGWKATAQTVHVARVFNRVHFTDDEPIVADEVSVTLAYLDDWALEEFIGETMIFAGDAEELQKIDLSIEVRPTRKVDLPDGNGISLAHSFGVTGRRATSRSLEQGYRLHVSSVDKTPVDDLLDLCSDVQDLVSIATGRNAEFKNILAYHPDLVHSRPGQKDFRVPFKVYARWQVKDRSSNPGQIDSDDMFFSFSQLGEMEGLEGWMRVAARYRTSLGRAMSTRATPNMFVSDRMLNYTAALEGFDRIKTGQERTKLIPRLKRCALAEPAILDMVGNVNKWAQAVAYHRNDIAHHLGRHPRGSSSEQYYLGESVYWVFVLCLLREMDAPQVVFDRISRHQAIDYLVPKIRAVVAAHR